MLAARAGNAALVEALLDQGADRMAQDEFGHTAWQHAVSRSIDEPAFAKAALALLFERIAPAIRKGEPAPQGVAQDVRSIGFGVVRRVCNSKAPSPAKSARKPTSAPSPGIQLSKYKASNVAAVAPMRTGTVAARCGSQRRSAQSPRPMAADT